MRKFQLNQRRVAIVCAVILVGLSTVTVLKQRGLFDTARGSDVSARAESTAKKTESTAQTAPVDQTANKAADTSTQQTKQQSEQKTEQPAEPAAKTEQTKPAEQTAKVEQTKPAEQPANTAASTEKSSETLTYTAQAGDSYTSFAREAVASVAAKQNVSLDSAQALQAEVELVNNAGSPLLDIGQTVAISRAAVETAIKNVAPATAAQPAADANKSNAAPAKAENYSAVASSGDSYTSHARTAVAKYLQNNKQTLSAEQTVAAESYIVVAAGSPLLDVGQTVTIDAATVSTAVTRASALSASEQAAWAEWTS